MTLLAQRCPYAEGYGYSRYKEPKFVGVDFDEVRHKLDYAHHPMCMYYVKGVNDDKSMLRRTEEQFWGRKRKIIDEGSGEVDDRPLPTHWGVYELSADDRFERINRGGY